MLEFLISLIPTALVLGVLIFVHELGHFLACRYAGVGVEKFSIGFGPEVVHWQGKETRYAISWIPVGGFVKPQGESSEEVDKRGGVLDPRDFLAASRLNRFLILIAGVAMNFLLAVVLFFFVLVLGRHSTSSEIGGFVEGLPAETSGLEVGDIVSRVNGTEVKNWRDLTINIAQGDGFPLQFTVVRAGEALELEVTPIMIEGRDTSGQAAQIPRIGIIPAIEKYSIWQAPGKAVQEVWKLTSLTLQALWKLVTGQLSPKALAGPLGIVMIAGTAAQMGIVTMLQFTALLSISLGVINLLPIPALDGGHVFFLGIEALRGKPVNPVIQDRVTQYGFFFLMFLMVFVFYNDLLNFGFIESVKSFFSPK